MRRRSRALKKKKKKRSKDQKSKQRDIICGMGHQTATVDSISAICLIGFSVSVKYMLKINYNR